jgi:hypothetical protein
MYMDIPCGSQERMGYGRMQRLYDSTTGRTVRYSISICSQRLHQYGGLATHLIDSELVVIRPHGMVDVALCRDRM